MPQNPVTFRCPHCAGAITVVKSKRNHDDIHWQSVDWSRKTSALARDLQVAKSFVSLARRKFAPETMAYKYSLLAGRKRRVK